jgi:hypothetical protein
MDKEKIRDETTFFMVRGFLLKYKFPVFGEYILKKLFCALPQWLYFSAILGFGRRAQPFHFRRKKPHRRAALSPLHQPTAFRGTPQQSSHSNSGNTSQNR